MEQHAIIVADKNGVIQFWSQGAVDLIGYSQAEAVGQRLDLVVPPDLRDKHWHGFGEAMNGGPATAAGTFFEIPVNCRGAIRTMRGQLHVLRSEHDGPIGAMAIFTTLA